MRSLTMGKSPRMPSGSSALLMGVVVGVASASDEREITVAASEAAVATNARLSSVMRRSVGERNAITAYNVRLLRSRPREQTTHRCSALLAVSVCTTPCRTFRGISVQSQPSTRNRYNPATYEMAT